MRQRRPIQAAPLAQAVFIGVDDVRQMILFALYRRLKRADLRVDGFPVVQRRAGLQRVVERAAQTLPVPHQKRPVVAQQLIGYQCAFVGQVDHRFKRIYLPHTQQPDAHLPVFHRRFKRRGINNDLALLGIPACQEALPPAQVLQHIPAVVIGDHPRALDVNELSAFRHQHAGDQALVCRDPPNGACNLPRRRLVHPVYSRPKIPKLFKADHLDDVEVVDLLPGYAFQMHLCDLADVSLCFPRHILLQPEHYAQLHNGKSQKADDRHTRVSAHTHTGYLPAGTAAVKRSPFAFRHCSYAASYSSMLMDESCRTYPL